MGNDARRKPFLNLEKLLFSAIRFDSVLFFFSLSSTHTHTHASTHTQTNTHAHTTETETRQGRRNRGLLTKARPEQTDRELDRRRTKGKTTPYRQTGSKRDGYPTQTKSKLILHFI